MHPVLLDLGWFQIHAYGAMGATGFLVGCGLVLWRARQQALDLNHVADVIFWTAAAALVGSRLLFLVQHPETIEQAWDIFDVRGGGLVFYGSFILGIPTGFLLMWRLGLPALATWDVFATGMPLAHGLSRVGCFLAGCCWGLPSDGPLAVTFPESSNLAPSGVPLHPVQLYEAASLMVVALLTNLFYRHRRFDGQVLLVYVVLYAIVRSLTEVFRGDLSRGWFLPELLGETLSMSQGLSLIFALVALTIALVGGRRRQGPIRPVDVV